MEELLFLVREAEEEDKDSILDGSEDIMDGLTGWKECKCFPAGALKRGPSKYFLSLS